MSVLERMRAMKISQRDMLFALRERGVETQPPQLSSILNGLYTYPKAKRILAECDKIVAEQEQLRAAGK